MDQTPDRHLRVNFLLPGAGLAGGVRTVRQLSDVLVARGHAVSVAYCDPPVPPWRGRAFLSHLRERLSGGRQHHLGGAADLIRVRRAVILPEDVPDADVTIGTFWMTMEWLRDWPAEKGRLAYYVQHHEVYSDATPDAASRVPGTYSDPPSTKLCVAHWLCRVMRDEYGQEDVVLLPNGLCWEQFESRPRERATRPTIGMLYSHKRWKGWDIACAAIERIRETVPDLRVIAYGASPIFPLHEAMTPTDIEYHIQPGQNVIPELYRACDAWIVPSRTEGFGLPALEAAASHCPVVATRSGGPEDIVVDGETGYLVETEDPEALARGVVRVLGLDGEAWRRMSVASYAKVRTFDWARTAEIFEREMLARCRANASPPSDVVEVA